MSEDKEPAQFSIAYTSGRAGEARADKSLTSCEGVVSASWLEQLEPSGCGSNLSRTEEKKRQMVALEEECSFRQARDLIMLSGAGLSMKGLLEPTLEKGRGSLALRGRKTREKGWC